MQQAIMTFDAAVNTAKTYTIPMGQVCKKDDGAEAATRLFTKMNPMASSQVPLALRPLGRGGCIGAGSCYGRLLHHESLKFSSIIDGGGHLGVLKSETT